MLQMVVLLSEFTTYFFLALFRFATMSDVSVVTRDVRRHIILHWYQFCLMIDTPSSLILAK